MLKYLNPKQNRRALILKAETNKRKNRNCGLPSFAGKINHQKFFVVVICNTSINYSGRH